ncbi:MAG: glycosyltransferase [Planctomycetota bacterium]
MRIVLLMPFFGPSRQVRGPVVQATEICRQLALRGHTVSVVTTSIDVDRGTQTNKWVQRDGYRVFHAEASGIQTVPPYYTPAVKEPLTEAIQDADVLYLRVGLTLTNEIARRIAARFNVPFVYNAEGCLCPVRLRTKAVAKWGFLRLFERRILRHAKRLHAATEQEATNYLSQGAARSRIDVIPNGIVLPDLDRDNLLFAQPESSFQPTVLFLGRIVSMKGPDRLIEAFQKILSQHDAQLVIAGPESDFSHQLMQSTKRVEGLAERVHFPGVLQGVEKDAALRSADLFALPSDSEGLPNALLEALAYGLPCIASPECHVPEIERLGAGMIVDPNVDEIARAMMSLFSDPVMLKDMGHAARNLAASKFSMDSVVEQVEASLFKARGESEDFK